MFKTPGGYSLMIAAIVTIVLIVLLLVFELMVGIRPVYAHLITGTILFLSTYIVVSRLFLKFIHEKINPIYKYIQKSTLSMKQLQTRFNRNDMMAEVKKDVEDWTNDQTEEIKKLKRLEKYRRDFIGDVSHELKTPVFNIQGYILTLLEGGMDDPKVNRLYLERTERSINRLISILDDLDSISRLDSGEFKLQREKFNIVKLVEDIFESQEMQARQMNIRLGFDGNYNKPIRVLADRKKIMEVLSNLVVNSIKYGRRGGKTLVGFVDTGDTILVDVTDDGIGIDQEDLPRIFDRFYRVDKSRSRESGGTGLGLSIVRHIIQAHKQSINVRSKPGEGTSFIFSLEKA